MQLTEQKKNEKIKLTNRIALELENTKTKWIKRTKTQNIRRHAVDVWSKCANNSKLFITNNIYSENIYYMMKKMNLVMKFCEW